MIVEAFKVKVPIYRKNIESYVQSYVEKAVMDEETFDYSDYLLHLEDVIREKGINFRLIKDFQRFDLDSKNSWKKDRGKCLELFYPDLNNNEETHLIEITYVLYWCDLIPLIEHFYLNESDRKSFGRTLFTKWFSRLCIDKGQLGIDEMLGIVKDTNNNRPYIEIASHIFPTVKNIEHDLLAI